MRSASKPPTDPGYREEIEFTLDLRAEAEARLRKADQQLSKAKGARRCALLVWQYELPDDLPLLQREVGTLSRSSFPNVDEVWLTMAHALDFYRIDLAR